MRSAISSHSHMRWRLLMQRNLCKGLAKEHDHFEYAIDRVESGRAHIWSVELKFLCAKPWNLIKNKYILNKVYEPKLNERRERKKNTLVYKVKSGLGNRPHQIENTDFCLFFSLQYSWRKQMASFQLSSLLLLLFYVNKTIVKMKQFKNLHIHFEEQYNDEHISAHANAEKTVKWLVDFSCCICCRLISIGWLHFGYLLACFTSEKVDLVALNFNTSDWSHWIYICVMLLFFFLLPFHVVSMFLFNRTELCVGHS